MHPILFVIESGSGARPVASFGVLLALGILLGAIVAVRAAVRAGFDGGDALAAISVVACGGLAGGYALQVVVETLRGAKLSEAAAAGGLTFYGAPVLGFLALVVATRALRMPLARFCDVTVGAVPLAHALGRMGCFFAGCCYGRPSDGPCAVTFTHPFSLASLEPVARHPVQLYESAMLLALAFGFALVPPKRVGTGERAIAYAAAYACVRLVAERFRGDPERGFVAPFMSTSDAISLAVLAVALAAIASMRLPRRLAA